MDSRTQVPSVRAPSLTRVAAANRSRGPDPKLWVSDAQQQQQRHPLPPSSILGVNPRYKIYDEDCEFMPAFEDEWDRIFGSQSPGPEANTSCPSVDSGYVTYTSQDGFSRHCSPFSSSWADSCQSVRSVASVSTPLTQYSNKDEFSTSPDATIGTLSCLEEIGAQISDSIHSDYGDLGHDILDLSDQDNFLHQVSSPDMSMSVHCEEPNLTKPGDSESVSTESGPHNIDHITGTRRPTYAEYNTTCNRHRSQDEMLGAQPVAVRSQSGGSVLLDNGFWSESSVLGAFKKSMALIRRLSTSPNWRCKKRHTLLCPLCPRGPLLDAQEIVAHIGRHIDDLRANDPRAMHVCDPCNMAFVHKADLEYHVSSAAKHGHCGFEFAHRRPCRGHHNRSSKATDDEKEDYFRMCYRIWNWEQAQLEPLKMFCREIESAHIDCERWTLDVSELSPLEPRNPLDSENAVSATPVFDGVTERRKNTGVHSQIQEECHLSSLAVGSARELVGTVHHFAVQLGGSDDEPTSGKTRSLCPQDAVEANQLDRSKSSGFSLTEPMEPLPVEYNPDCIKVTQDKAASLPNDVVSSQASALLPPDITPSNEPFSPGRQYQSKHTESYQRWSFVKIDPVPLDTQMAPSSQTRPRAQIQGIEHRLRDQMHAENIAPTSTSTSALNASNAKTSKEHGTDCQNTLLDLCPSTGEVAPSSRVDVPGPTSLVKASSGINDWPSTTEGQDLRHSSHKAHPPDRAVAEGNQLHGCEETATAAVGDTGGSSNVAAWITSQANESVAESIVDCRADTPSSMPLFDSTICSTPGRTLSDRINDYFLRRQADTQDDSAPSEGLAAVMRQRLGQLFEALCTHGPVTVGEVVRTCAVALRRNGVCIDTSSILSWSNEYGDRRNAITLRSTFVDLILLIHEDVRETDDAVFDLARFVAYLEHVGEADGQPPNSPATVPSDYPRSILTSFGGSDRQSSSSGYTGGPGQVFSSPSQSGANRFQGTAKRNAPDEGDDDTYGQLHVDHDGEHAPKKRPNANVPCILRQCSGKDSSIADMLRKVEKHGTLSNFVCGACYTKFTSPRDKQEHTLQGCSKICVLTICSQNEGVAAVSASDIMVLRHEATLGCPSSKNRLRDRWRFLYALCYPESSIVPEPDFTPGTKTGHSTPGSNPPRAAASRPLSQQQLQERLDEVEGLLRLQVGKNATLRREKAETEAQKARVESERDLQRRDITTMSFLLDFCAKQSANVIPPEIKNLIAVTNAPYQQQDSNQLSAQHIQSRNDFTANTPQTGPRSSTASVNDRQQGPLMHRTLQGGNAYEAFSPVSSRNCGLPGMQNTQNLEMPAWEDQEIMHFLNSNDNHLSSV